MRLGPARTECKESCFALPAWLLETTELELSESDQGWQRGDLSKAKTSKRCFLKEYFNK